MSKDDDLFQTEPEAKKDKQRESVNHPKHYNSGKIEVISAIEDWELGFSLGNAIKYIARAGKKSPETYTQDLEKALWYINRELQRASQK
jgi:hypothetical protein